MASSRAFQEALRRLRGGEPEAVREFVRAYEPYIRRTVRRRLGRSPARVAADSDDLCQSVLGSFLVRLAAGEYELGTHDDLLKLLAGIVRNKVAALTRRESAQRRDRTITLNLSDSDNLPADAADEPSQQAVHKDVLAEVQARLSPAERTLFELRRAGHSWETIAGRVGDTPVALRKCLSRALRRVSIELRLEDADE